MPCSRKRPACGCAFRPGARVLCRPIAGARWCWAYGRSTLLGQGAPDASFDALVEVTEQLGSEIVLEAQAGGMTVTVARVDSGANVSPGERVRLCVIPERLHFFDAASGQAIR